MTIVRQAQNDVDNNTFKLAPINKKVKKTGSERRKKRQPYQVGEKDCSFVELCNHKELGRRICLRLGKYLGLVNIYMDIRRYLRNHKGGSKKWNLSKTQTMCKTRFGIRE